MAGIFDYLLDAPSGKQVVPRNMQQVAPAMKEVFGERLPNAALEGPAEAAGQAAKRGLLGRVLGVAAGPVGMGVQAATHAGDLNEGEDAIVKQRQDAERDAYYTANPQEARDAMSYGQGVGQRAAQAGINYAYDQTQKGDQGSGDGKLLMTQETKTTPATPEVPPEVVEHAKKQTEAKRQVVQQGTVKALQTNQVSRPELAEEIVKSDVARTGQELTPDAFKARVAEETSNMKSMDNNDLSKYVSYALVAAGLIASFADKSGKAGDTFSGSFNKQLDRNLQGGINNAKLQAKATENAQKNAIDTYKLKQTDEGNKIRSRAVDVDEKRTTGQLSFWDKQGELGDKRIDVQREGNNIQAAGVNATIGMKNAQLDLNRELAATRQANEDRDYGLKKESLAIRKAKAATEGDKFTAPEISSKAAQDLVASRAKGTGIPIAKSALPQVAEQLRVLIKDDPRGYAANPTLFHDTAIKQAGLKQTGNTNLWDDRELTFPK